MAAMCRLIGCARLMLVVLHLPEISCDWYNPGTWGDSRRRSPPPAPPNGLKFSNPVLPDGKYTSALKWESYTDENNNEISHKFTGRYPSDFIKGFVSFDMHTCGTWDSDPAVRKQHMKNISGTNADGLECVKELNKPENYMYYGVTRVTQITDSGNRRYNSTQFPADQTFPDEDKAWDWRTSPDQTDMHQSRSAGFQLYGECYFITKRCTSLLPVKFKSNGTIQYDSGSTKPHMGTTGEESGIFRRIEFQYYDPPWSQNIKSFEALKINDGDTKGTGSNTQISVITFLRQRPFTGVPSSVPYARKNDGAAEEHKVDHGFSLPEVAATLPDFSRSDSANTQDHFEILNVHEVSDPRQKLGPSKFDAEYVLVRKGHRCGGPFMPGKNTLTRALEMDSRLTDKGFVMTPLDCANACADLNGRWFLYGTLTQRCQCYRPEAALAPPSKCHPVASPDTDLFEFGTEVADATYRLVKQGALCMGFGSTTAGVNRHTRYHMGTRPSVATCAHACRDHSQFFAYDATAKTCLCDLPYQGDEGCGLHMTSGTTQAQHFSHFTNSAPTTVDVTASAFALYRFKQSDFFLVKQNGCCADNSAPSVLSCSAARTVANGTLDWIDMPHAKTLVACSRACNGVSTSFVYRMSESVDASGVYTGTPMCHCLVPVKTTGTTHAFTRTPNYMLVSDASNVVEHRDVSLEFCKQECSGTPVCRVKGFSWMRLNGQNVCRISIGAAASVAPLRYLDTGHTDAGVVALAGLYRMPTLTNFECKHTGTYFRTDTGNDAKLNQYRLYSFELRPLLIQQNSVCSTVGGKTTHVSITDKVSSPLQCAEACVTRQQTPWSAYGREKASDGSATGMCTKGELSRNLYCACQCQKTDSCDKTVSRYAMDLYFYPGNIEAPRSTRESDLLKLDRTRVNFAELKCAWKVSRDTMCHSWHWLSDGVTPSQYEKNGASTYRKECVKSGTCNGYASVSGFWRPHLPEKTGYVNKYVKDKLMECTTAAKTAVSYVHTTFPWLQDMWADVTMNLQLLEIRKCFSIHQAYNHLPEALSAYCLDSATHYEYVPSACSCAWETIPGYSCAALKGTSSSARYVTSIEEASRICVSLRDTECKYGFSHSATKNAEGGTKYTMHMAQHGRCDGVGGSRSGRDGSTSAIDSVYVRFTPEDCLPDIRPSVSSLDDIYTIRADESTRDDSKDSCAWTRHEGKMCMDPKAYRWHGDTIKRTSTTVGAGVETVQGTAPKWKGIASCQVLDTFFTRPMKMEGMIRHIGKTHNSYTAQTEEDVTGFNYFPGGNYENSFAKHETGYENGQSTITDYKACYDAQVMMEVPLLKDNFYYYWGHYPMGYERGMKELYQWGSFVASKANRQCVMVPVPKGVYYEHHPWKCKPCSTVDGIKSCHRQTVYTRSDLYDQETPSYTDVKKMQLPVVSNWLNACREHCRADGSKCNAFVIDEAFGSFKCLTLRVSSAARQDPLVVPVASQRKSSGKVDHEKPAWQVQRGRVLHVALAMVHSGKTLDECMDLCSTSFCLKHGFSFQRGTSTDWNLDPPRGECRTSTKVGENIPFDIAHNPATEGALYYRTNVTWNRLDNVKCTGNYKAVSNDGNSALTFHQCRLKCEHHDSATNSWGMCKRFGFSFTVTDPVAGTGECRIPVSADVAAINLMGVEYGMLPGPLRAQQDAMNIDKTNTFFYHNKAQASTCSVDKDCLRNSEPFAPCQSEALARGSTSALYYPQYRIEPPTVLTIGAVSEYDFTAQPAMRCTSFGRMVNGVVTSPRSAEHIGTAPNVHSDNTFILSIDNSIDLEKCKRMCLGTPGCPQHGFSFGTASSGHTGGPSSGISGGVGITSGYVLKSNFDTATVNLRADECYNKCLSTPGCIETGYSWHIKYATTQGSLNLLYSYYNCRIPTNPTKTASYELQPANTLYTTADDIAFNTVAADAAFYRANTCFLPHYDAASPCKHAADATGIGTFYTLTPKNAATTSIKPTIDAKQILNWTHIHSGIRNAVYYADKSYSTSPGYAPDLQVPMDYAPSHHQIGESHRPAFGSPEALDIPTSHVGNDRYQDLVASFCRHRCAMTMSCVSFKVDMASAPGECRLYGSALGTGPLAFPNNVTGQQPDPTAFYGMSYTMARAYAEQSVQTIKDLLTMLSLDYGDLLSPVSHSHENVRLYYHTPVGTAQEQCDTKSGNSYIAYNISDVSLEWCKQMRRQLFIGTVTAGGEKTAIKWTDDGNTAWTRFSYRPATASSGSLCVIPMKNKQCNRKLSTGSRVYEPAQRTIDQLYSKDVNPWVFEGVDTVSECALRCMALYMQGCRVMTLSADDQLTLSKRKCYLFAHDETGKPTAATDFSGNTGRRRRLSAGVASPSYRVRHPSMHMKVNLGIYEYIDDFAADQRCAAAGSAHEIPGAANLEVGAQNALVECADRCARASEHFPRNTSYPGSATLGCAAFSVQVPNLCTLYTRCDKTTRAGAAATTWNYRVRLTHGPFVYSGTPSQRCETEYEDLALGAAAVNGPVQKDTATNPVQQCMELCAAHSAKVGKAGKGCGGFSLSDSGECRLHGPCKLSQPTGATTNVVVDRTVWSSFKFHGGFSPASHAMNSVVRTFPETSPVYAHSAAWGRAVTGFCSIQHGPGWRAATTAEAKLYAQYGSARVRRWADGFGHFDQGQWIAATSASDNHAACFRPPVPKRYYQLPTSVSVYTRMPKLNHACSATPLLRHSGVVGEDPMGSQTRDLLKRCADACSVNARGMAMAQEGGQDAPPKSSGCVGFTVSTAGHCDLHVQCNTGSVRYVEPEFDVLRVSYSMEAMDVGS